MYILIITAGESGQFQCVSGAVTGNGRSGVSTKALHPQW